MRITPKGLFEEKILGGGKVKKVALFRQMQRRGGECHLLAAGRNYENIELRFLPVFDWVGKNPELIRAPRQSVEDGNFSHN